MRVDLIRVDGLRNLRQVDIEPSPGFNLILGENGAGKTSLIEALHLMAHGRSFRAGPADDLTAQGRDGFSTFVDLTGPGAQRRHLGMARTGGSWALRCNGAPVPTLVEFVRLSAVVTLEPETHRLIAGPAETRRAYLDWLLFHVEPEFLAMWRRYLRALRQRNAALRTTVFDADMVEVWEQELALSGEQIDRSRRRLLGSISEVLQPLLARLLPKVAIEDVRYRSGWPTGTELREALADGRRADRERGFTQRGPHRSDWRIHYRGLSRQNQLSRGQAKLTAIACLLSQGVKFRDATGDWPIFACDDLASELDQSHQGVVLEWLSEAGAQVFISGTEQPDSWGKVLSDPVARFHVEQGQISRLL